MTKSKLIRGTAVAMAMALTWTVALLGCAAATGIDPKTGVPAPGVTLVGPAGPISMASVKSVTVSMEASAVGSNTISIGLSVIADVTRVSEILKDKKDAEIQVDVIDAKGGVVSTIKGPLSQFGFS